MVNCFFTSVVKNTVKKISATLIQLTGKTALGLLNVVRGDIKGLLLTGKKKV